MSKKKFINACTSLFIRLFAINIICFIMCIFIFAISNTMIVRMVVQTICLVIMFTITYSFCHKYGDSDAALVNSGYFKKNYFKGFYLGLIANLPFFATGILLVLSKLSLFSHNYLPLYRIINSFYFPFNYSILPVSLNVFEIGWWKIIMSLLTFLIIPITAGLSYNLGLIRFYISEKLLYKKDSE